MEATAAAYVKVEPRRNDFKSNGDTMHHCAIRLWGKQSTRKSPAAEDDKAASFTNGPPQTDTLCGSKPPCFINGFISHGCKDGSTNTSPLKVKKKKRKCCRTGEGGDPNGFSANGTTEDEKMLPHPNLPSARIKQRASKKLKDKMWKACKEFQENSTLVQEEENWESEIQDVIIPDWKKMHFGDSPYVPDDLLHFSMRGLTLNPQDLIFQKVGYRPAKHHPDPIHWHYYSRSSEPGQFADAQEE
ncbi:uncharacterized protein LOC114466260 [Gouania willdenowi]|uniref:uncharacterized protein LOC114466260 n=1 Tax=Gouania willdenowi TaxID=441366 RepID=UPI001055C0E7|nr:uncharacterized protein LOC114466260 [Gouania willdenowi]